MYTTGLDNFRDSTFSLNSQQLLRIGGLERGQWNGKAADRGLIPEDLRLRRGTFLL